MIGLEKFFHHLAVKGYSKSFRNTSRQILFRFSEHLKQQGIEDMREVKEDILYDYMHYLMKVYRTRLNEPLSSSSVHNTMSRVRTYFRFLYKEKLILLNPAKNLEIPHVEHAKRYVPTYEEIRGILESPDPYTHTGIRDKAILELIYSSGLRWGEAVNLDLNDIDFKQNTVRIREPKNKKERIVPFGRHAKEALEKYIIYVRPKYVKSETQNILFAGNQKNSIRFHDIYGVINRNRKNPKITMHSLRHAAAIGMLKNGAGIRYVQEFLGHNRISSSQIYTMLLSDDLKDIHSRFHPRERIKK